MFLRANELLPEFFTTQMGTLDDYRQWTHVRTYGTDVFAMDMLSSISQVRGDKLMKPMAFYCVFILVLRRLLPDF